MQLSKYHMRIADRGGREFYKLAMKPEGDGYANAKHSARRSLCPVMILKCKMQPAPRYTARN